MKKNVLQNSEMTDMTKIITAFVAGSVITLFILMSVMGASFSDGDTSSGAAVGSNSGAENEGLAEAGVVDVKLNIVDPEQAQKGVVTARLDIIN